LSQTFGDFEFIIIDDGSTDNTQKIIRDFQDDGRIVYLRNNENAGIVASLNKALGAAKGTYIARMDADDIALPQRLDRQQDYLNSHPAVGLLGCWYEWIDDNDNALCVVTPPERHNLIIWDLLFGNCFAHSGVVFRRSLLSKVNGYSKEDLHGEDYALWIRLGVLTEFANVPRVLIKKRTHKTAIARIFFLQQRELKPALMKRAMSVFLEMDADIDTVCSLRDGLDGLRLESGRSFKSAAGLIRSLYLNFVLKKSLSDQERKAIKSDMIEKVCILACGGFRFFPLQSLGILIPPFVLAPCFTAKNIIRRITKKGGQDGY
jgi:glycosyltransferase involved in cell wall biosynthesis